jgi:hypothetical protein
VAKMKYRYVEIHFFLSDTEERQFRAVITEAASPRDAVLEAKRNTFRQHPDASNVEEFMQVAITKDKADEIAELMRNGQWTGWNEQNDTGPDIDD